MAQLELTPSSSSGFRATTSRLIASSFHGTASPGARSGGPANCSRVADGNSSKRRGRSSIGTPLSPFSGRPRKRIYAEIRGRRRGVRSPASRLMSLRNYMQAPLNGFHARVVQDPRHPQPACVRFPQAWRLSGKYRTNRPTLPSGAGRPRHATSASLRRPRDDPPSGPRHEIHVVLAEPGDHLDAVEIILIKGHAGSGKSVLLRRIAWDASHNYNAVALMLQPQGSLVPNAIRELLGAIDDRLYLFIDDAADRAREITTLVREIGNEGKRLTLLMAERSNEWNISGAGVDPYLSEQYLVPYLEIAEINGLIELLAQHCALGTLEQSSSDERVVVQTLEPGVDFQVQGSEDFPELRRGVAEHLFGQFTQPEESVEDVAKVVYVVQLTHLAVHTRRWRSPPGSGGHHVRQRVALRIASRPYDLPGFRSP